LRRFRVLELFLLRNHPFRNMYTDPYTSYGMGGFATHSDTSQWVAEPPIPEYVYGSVYMLRNGWFCNIFEHLIVLLRCYSAAPPLFHSSASAPDANYPPTLPPTTLHHHHHLTFDLPPPFNVLSFLKIKGNMVIYLRADLEIF